MRGAEHTKRRVSDPYGGRPLQLSEELTQRIQESFGIDPESLKLRESEEVVEMGAHATAQGDVIRFAPGEFQPHSPEGLSVLGHELAHVREQAQGDSGAGGQVLCDPASEARSDSAGEAFTSGMASGASPVAVLLAAAPVPGKSASLGQIFKVWKHNRRAKKRAYKLGGEDLDTWLESKRFAKENSSKYLKKQRKARKKEKKQHVKEYKKKQKWIDNNLYEAEEEIREEVERERLEHLREIQALNRKEMKEQDKERKKQGLPTIEEENEDKEQRDEDTFFYTTDEEEAQGIEVPWEEIVRRKAAEQAKEQALKIWSHRNVRCVRR